MGVFMNPVLKYRGGKSREIPHFIKYIPDDYNRYIEPFFGGGAVFFHLEPQKAIINDLNSRLMQFYIQLRDSYDLMRIQLDKLQKVYEANQLAYKKSKAANPNDRVPNANEDLYYYLRDLFNQKDNCHPLLNFSDLSDDLLEGVIYFFINKTAYSGMIRYNSAGEYNVPFGRYPNLNTNLVTEHHSQLLKNAEIYNTDYREIFELAQEDDFIWALYFGMDRLGVQEITKTITACHAGAVDPVHL